MKDEQKSVFRKYKELLQSALNDLKTEGRRYRQIPNILTLLRLTAPFFIIPASLMGNLPLAIGLTVGFGLTDLADGIIARKCNLTSELGKNLDAVCDKVFAATLLIAASFANPILLCNLALEIGIAGINVYKTLKGQDVHSTLAGKAKTWALFSLAGLGLITPFLNSATLLNVLVGITLSMQGLTIMSCLLEKDEKNQEKNIKKNKTNLVSNDELKKEIIQEEKIKTKEKEKINCENAKILRELKSTKDYLLSQQQIQKDLKQEHKTGYQKKLENKKNPKDTV